MPKKNSNCITDKIFTPGRKRWTKRLPFNICSSGMSEIKAHQVCKAPSQGLGRAVKAWGSWALQTPVVQPQVCPKKGPWVCKYLSILSRNIKGHGGSKWEIVAKGHKVLPKPPEFCSKGEMGISKRVAGKTKLCFPVSLAGIWTAGIGLT